MMNSIAPKLTLSNGVVEAVAEVNEEVTLTNELVASLMDEIREQREYIKAMEIRMHTRNEAAFRDVEKMIGAIGKEVAKMGIGALAKPQDVVKEIERQSAIEKKRRDLDENMARLQAVVAEYLANDLPLVRERSTYAHPQFTPQGDAVYKEVSRFLTELAKINSRNKEYYTNAAVYQHFFDRFNIKRYKRAAVRTADGKQFTTLLAAIVVNGHIKQYINFIKTLSNEDRKEV